MIFFLFILNLAAAALNIFMAWPGVGSDNPVNMIVAVFNGFVAGLLFQLLREGY